MSTQQLSVPANWCGEIVTCLCGEGCDGMGSCTWRRCSSPVRRLAKL